MALTIIYLIQRRLNSPVTPASQILSASNGAPKYIKACTLGFYTKQLNSRTAILINVASDDPHQIDGRYLYIKTALCLAYGFSHIEFRHHTALI